MADREKVIKGLECCATNRLRREDCEAMDCAYLDLEGHGCIHQLIRDALALLKAQEPIEARLHLCESCTKKYPECDAAIDGVEFGSGIGNDNIIGCTAYVNRWKAQEPRLLTLDEIHDSMVVYLEAGTEFLKIVDDDGVVLAIGGSERMGAKCFITVWDVGVAAKCDEYNVTWRAWSQRPTKEQREREPWDRRVKDDQR